MTVYTLALESKQVDCSQASIRDTSVYVGENRSDKANFLVVSKNDKNGTPTYLAVENPQPLTQVLWTFPTLKDGWYRFNLLRLPIWNSGIVTQSEVKDVNNVITQYATIVYHVNSNTVYKAIAQSLAFIPVLQNSEFATNIAFWSPGFAWSSNFGGSAYYLRDDGGLFPTLLQSVNIVHGRTYRIEFEIAWVFTAGEVGINFAFFNNNTPGQILDSGLLDSSESTITYSGQFVANANYNGIGAYDPNFSPQGTLIGIYVKYFRLFEEGISSVEPSVTPDWQTYWAEVTDLSTLVNYGPIQVLIYNDDIVCRLEDRYRDYLEMALDMNGCDNVPNSEAFEKADQLYNMLNGIESLNRQNRMAQLEETVRIMEEMFK